MCLRGFVCPWVRGQVRAGSSSGSYINSPDSEDGVLGSGLGAGERNGWRRESSALLRTDGWIFAHPYMCVCVRRLVLIAALCVCVCVCVCGSLQSSGMCVFVPLCQ